MNNFFRCGFLISSRLFAIGMLHGCSIFPSDHITVQEEDKVAIVVKGDVDDELRDNIVNHLALANADCSSPEWRVRGLFAKADPEVQNALQALGYYAGKVTKHLQRAEDCWEASFTVEPGARVGIATVDITLSGAARDDPVFSALLRKLPLKPNSPLNHGDYERSKALLQSLALQRGYFDSRFSVHELQVNPQTRTADIRLHFDSGPRYKFGALHIEQDVLNPGFVARMISLREGEPYDSKKLTALNQALINSNYFSLVDINPRIRDRAGLEVPLDVRLSPRKKHFYRLGAGADTDTGPRLTAGYENRRINRRGHRFKADLKLSPILSEASAEYRIPLYKPLYDYFAAQTGYKYENTDNTKTNKILAGGKYVRQLENGWLQTLGLYWTDEKFRAGLQDGKAKLILPEVGWMRRYADDNIWIRHGYALNFELRGSEQVIFSDVSFFQFRATGKGIEQLPWSWAGRLLGRAELGFMAVSDFSRLPVSYRFFAGGDQSVRGYRYKEIGPTDASGEAIGGQYLGVFSFEYEQPVTENWGVAAFVDTGSVTDTFNFAFKTGVGLGVRWHTLIGPLRVDFAVPLNEAQDAFRVHFSMGPEF
ncbi:MAG: autotransporter assembly complex protein TamA [Gammaproteobacteria bacterium]